MAVEVAQRSRGGGGRGGNPLGGGRAAKSHGEEIVAIIYFILLVIIRPALDMEVVQEQPVTCRSEDVQISVGIGVGVVVVLAAVEKYSFSAGSHPFPTKPSTVYVAQHTWMDCIQPE